MVRRRSSGPSSERALAWLVKWVIIGPAGFEGTTRLPRGVGNGMDVSPDGRSLLFAQTESISEDLMMVEGFQ